MKIPNTWASDTNNSTFIRVNERVWAKMELNNPTGSIKDRPIRYIVEKALLDGSLRKGMRVIEATSGNTGISLSAICSCLGLDCTIIMPSNASAERRKMMKRFGAKIVDVAPHDFTGAIALRNRMLLDAKSWSPMQFENPLNVECHRNTTAASILNWSKHAIGIDCFVSGAGTGGTMMGFWEAKTVSSPDTRCVLVKPAESDHGIQGIGDGGNYLLNESKMDAIELVSTEDAYLRAARFARDHGILVGPSSGANLLVADRVAANVVKGRCVVTLLCDRGERYLSEA